jgi:hypothetical protein
LKDLADTGYDPATHKVQGVVLTDTTTDVTNDVGITQAAADKAWGTAARTLTDLTGFSLSAAGIDAIWDELMAGHVTPDSAAYVMRSLQSIISTINLAQAGAAGSITLAAGASAVNDYYKGQTISIVTGTGAGQARACYGYNGATKVALTRPDWATAPDNTSYYAILNVGSSVVAAIEDIDFPATQKAQITTIDTVVDAIKAVTDTLVLADIADAVHDEAVEGLITGRQALKLMLAALVGKTSEAVANTLVIRDANDTADRITATMDANRYRTGVVLNP